MKQKCTDCKGTGKFQSFLREFNCELCGGSGELLVSEESQPVSNSDETIPKSEFYSINFVDLGIGIGINGKVNSKFQVGHYYKTRGGWKAICIWCNHYNFSLSYSNYYFIHKPNTYEESIPVCHSQDGRVIITDTMIPTYNQHPADIIEEWRE